MLGAMPRIARPAGLGELLEKQLSVVSRGQLLALGVTDNVMQYRVRDGGPWQALLPGVYLGVSGAPSLAQKEMAALLYAGPGSLITGPVALMHYSIRTGSDLDIIDRREIKHLSTEDLCYYIFSSGIPVNEPAYLSPTTVARSNMLIWVGRSSG